MADSADTLVCLLGPMKLTGEQLDFVTVRRHQEKLGSQPVLVEMLEHADWWVGSVQAEQQEQRRYLTPTIHVSGWIVCEAMSWLWNNAMGAESAADTFLGGPPPPSDAEVHARINDVLCAAIDSAIADGLQPFEGARHG